MNRAGTDLPANHRSNRRATVRRRSAARNKRLPRKRTHGSADQRLATTLAVSQVLAESPALDKAFPRVIEIIGETLGWRAGALWLPHDVSAGLWCGAFWRASTARLTNFERDIQSRSFNCGIGLPGRVWAALQPAWIPNVTTDENFPRSAI